MTNDGSRVRSALERLTPLLTESSAAQARVVDGYVDVLDDESSGESKSLAQRTMEFPLLAPIYEKLWRPAGVLAFMGFDIAHFWEERGKTVRALRLSRDRKVLDVACGPGNFTSAFADALDSDGLAIGLDISQPMLRKAAERNARPNTAYIRGDAMNLPFPDASLDAVTCYAALYLIPEPFKVLDEMVRVLKPGGRISVMATRASRRLPVRRAQRRVLSLTGLQMFDARAFTDYFASAGLTDIEQELHGVVQYVHATKPEG